MTETLPDGPAKQPTVREVALRAGVSPMTVSRTLAGGVNVRPDLQERVLTAVAELGYHRNENARSIRPGQPSGLIGVAITNIANPYYSTFALGRAAWISFKRAGLSWLSQRYDVLVSGSETPMVLQP